MPALIPRPRATARRLLSAPQRIVLILVALLPALLAIPGSASAAYNHNVSGNTVALVGDLVPDVDTQSLADAQAVADLTIAHNPQKIIHLGDLQYECATLANFRQNYEAVYGPVKSRVAPVIGNHEYCNGSDPNATGYKGYFGDQAYPNGASYYSFNVNVSATKHVHFLVINSNCLQWNTTAPGCAENQAMQEWIRNDLAADNAVCEIAVWHEPAFGSEVPYHGDGKDAMRSVWRTLDERGVDMVVTGHAHNYQRYQRMNYRGIEAGSGMPSTIVGTGGRSLHDVTDFSWHGALAALDDTHFGFLKMVFNSTATGWTQAFKTTTGSGSLDPISYGCT
jgi:predicted phosphodiesterase